MTNTTTTLDRVRNYEGQNTFVLEMKKVLNKYNGLTPKQEQIVEKILNQVVNLKSEDMSEDMKRIANYDGVNTFVLDISNKLKTYGTLTEKQKVAALARRFCEDTLNIDPLPTVVFAYKSKSPLPLMENDDADIFVLLPNNIVLARPESIDSPRYVVIFRDPVDL